MTSTSLAAAPAAFTFRRCVLLCLPALILGTAIRLSFLLATPQVYYGSDSNSYFSTAADLWTKHRYNLPPKRRYLYPLFETALPALPGSPAVWTSVIQHAAGLVAIVGIGWIVGQLTVRPSWWVVPITLAAALWPPMLWYEHEMIAESLVLMTYVLTVALALPFSRLRTSWGLFWFLVAATVLIALKPHGRPICLALLAVAALHVWGRLRLELKHYAVLAVTATIFIMGGKGSQTSWLLLSSALPLVNPEGERWQEYRECLKPLIEETRADRFNYAGQQWKYKKMLNNGEVIGPAWAKLLEDKEVYGSVCKGLALEAIRAHPVAYAGMIFRKAMLAASLHDTDQWMIPEKFWARQEETSEGRWDRRPAEMKLVYGMDEAGYNRIVAEGRARRFLLLPLVMAANTQAAWTKYVSGPVGGSPKLGLTWLGALAAFGLVTCLWPARFWNTAIVWLPPLFFSCVIFGVGDALTRYLHPTDWCWLVVIALGADFVCDRVGRLFKHSAA